VKATNCTPDQLTSWSTITSEGLRKGGSSLLPHVKIKLQIKGEEACPNHGENQLGLLGHKIRRRKKIRKSIGSKAKFLWIKKKKNRFNSATHPLR
jgi:hypothetical protein